MKNLVVLFGGVSTEHEVSRVSATSILKNLDKDKYNIFPIGITKDGRWLLYRQNSYDEIPNGNWENDDKNRRCIINPDRSIGGITVFNGELTEHIKIDCIFPVLHGLNGEDGTVQGLFEIANIPYVGCDVPSSANSMDKSITKIIVNELTDVKQADFYLALKYSYEQDKQKVINDADNTLGSYPVFVKPCSSGSSVGVHKVRNKEELDEALADAFKYDSKVLVEQFIDGREVEIAVRGNEQVECSVVGEIAPTQEFYSYDAKYNDNSSELYIPARISQKAIEQVADNAIKIYKALGCSGLSRVDFFCTKDEQIIFNEINTLPGFTSISMYPKLFAHIGLEYSDLLDELINLAIQKSEDKA